MQILERLQKYSGCDEQTCEAQLAKRDGNFWEALFDLAMETGRKEEFLQKLYAAEDPQEVLELLERMDKIYGGSGFHKVRLKIRDDDEAFYESDRPSLMVGLYELVPTPQELERYAALLRSPERDVIIKMLAVLRTIEVKHFSKEMIDEMKKLMKGKDAYVADEAMRSIDDGQPEKMAVFLNEIIHNLKPNRSQNHFTAVRRFRNEKVPVYPEITEALTRLTHSGNSQVRGMASDLLVRYGQISPEEKAAAERRRRHDEVEGIHYRVEKIKSAKALYTFADKFNWDEDKEYMFAVIDHEHCESATAKLVYWRSEPNYYQKFTDVEQVEEYHRDIYRLQREIEQGIIDGKYPAGKLKYDPKNDHDFDMTASNVPESEIKRAIPEFMY